MSRYPIKPRWWTKVSIFSGDKCASDARLASAMQRHSITHILTFNTADFARYPGLTALAPSHVKREVERIKGIQVPYLLELSHHIPHFTVALASELRCDNP